MSDLELLRLQAMSTFERFVREQGFRKIAGVDEAGRGPLAGPVVAAACILPDGVFFERLNDSKQLTAKQRDELFAQMLQTQGLCYGLGIVDAGKIDEINILQATFLAMQHAVAALPQKPDYLLVDGNRSPRFSIPSEAIIEGDARSVSIAAASILAKVTRDRLMEKYDTQYPQYGFSKHKGYGTAQHMAALTAHGACPIHRKSFAPVRRLLDEDLLFT